MDIEIGGRHNQINRQAQSFFVPLPRARTDPQDRFADDLELFRGQSPASQDQIEVTKQGRIFEPFEQAEGTRSRRFGGTGLGLSIVKHVLNLHQARLVIESEPGKGSTFACVFGSDRLLDGTRLQEAAGQHP